MNFKDAPQQLQELFNKINDKEIHYGQIVFKD